MLDRMDGPPVPDAHTEGKEPCLSGTKFYARVTPGTSHTESLKSVCWQKGKVFH